MADKYLHQPGIYCIRNLVTGQRYIGSSTNIFNRWVLHRCDLKNNKNVSRKLQVAWNKYGEFSFSFEILEIVLNPEFLVEREQHWIDLWKANQPDTGYNTRKHASTNLGNKHSAESKASMSRTRLGHPTSEVTRAKISAANKGRKFSHEIREKFSKSHLGKECPPEVRAKLSAANKGQKRSAEARVRMSNAQFKRWRSAVTSD